MYGLHEYMKLNAQAVDQHAQAKREDIMGKGKKVIVARKLLEEYLKHQREGRTADYQGRTVLARQHHILKKAHAKLWKDFDFDFEFGLIWHPATCVLQ